jgi:acetyl-CoA carboxylase biotin carboxyl carrier protein
MADLIADGSLETLLAEFTRSGVRELHIRSDGFELYLSNDAALPSPLVNISAVPSPVTIPAVLVPASAPPALALERASIDVPSDAVIICAPNLGTFYRAPKPGAPDYVQIGSEIEVGAELCLIEVMKLFTAVRADVAGRIHAILADDGSMVEAGQPLFAIVNI